ncbi:MAG: serine hydrolase [Microscillaceae bacterium]|nr:serine hydrolase [Microscillaceae bacterium]
MAKNGKLKKALAHPLFRPLRALYVWQNQQLVFGHDAYGPAGIYTPHEIQSTTKSLLALLVGILQGQGDFPEEDRPIYDYFPEYHHLNWQNGKDRITIRDLLTMRAGFDWNEGLVPYTQWLANHSNQMAQSQDWIEFALSRPMAHPPGQVFQYSSAHPILLTKIITQSTQKETAALFKEKLFSPLGIVDFWAPTSPHDSAIIGDLEMYPLDLLKIGRLVQQNGYWQGQEIIPPAQLQKLLSPQVFLPKGQAYGAMWWQQAFGPEKEELIYTWGYGGQHLFCCPSARCLF